MVLARPSKELCLVYHNPRENVFLETMKAGHRGEYDYIKEFAGEVCGGSLCYSMQPFL